MTLRGEMGNGWKGDAPSNTALLWRQRFVEEDKASGWFVGFKKQQRKPGPCFHSGPQEGVLDSQKICCRLSLDGVTGKDSGVPRWCHREGLRGP